MSENRAIARTVDSAFRCEQCSERCTSRRALAAHTETEHAEPPGKAALKAYIADHAAVWETEFAAGPGLVVSLDDAAHVAAKYLADVLAERREA